MLLLFVLGLFFMKQAEGVTCWTCSYTYTETERDKECVDAPWNVTQGGKETICPDSRFCTTVRQWDYTLDAVRSFARLCSESMGNRCLEDTTFGRQDCFTTCHEDLCNGHDGIPESAKKASGGSGGGYGIGVDSGTDKSESDSENGGSESGTENGNVDSGTDNGNADPETGNDIADSGTETRSDGSSGSGSSSGSNGFNGGSSGSGSSDDVDTNSVDTERKKTPSPLPAWDDAWNYKERSGRSSHGGADAVSSFLTLICFLSLVCLLF